MTRRTSLRQVRWGQRFKSLAKPKSVRSEDNYLILRLFSVLAPNCIAARIPSRLSRQLCLCPRSRPPPFKDRTRVVQLCTPNARSAPSRRGPSSKESCRSRMKGLGASLRRAVFCRRAWLSSWPTQDLRLPFRKFLPNRTTASPFRSNRRSN